MQALLLWIHIVAMSLSLFLTASAVVLGFMKKPALAPVAKAAAASTVLGGLSGGALLLFAPVASECIALSLYLLAFGLVYKFALGWGVAKASPFPRSKSM